MHHFGAFFAECVGLLNGDNQCGMMQVRPQRTPNIASNAHNAMIVFTDLDGTLLDHQSYHWDPAAPALAALKADEIPVILVSSKTLAELQQLRQALALPHPVVAENGALIDVPDNYFAQAPDALKPIVSRQELQAAYREVKANGGYQCQAFFEMGPEGIAAETGLSLLQAELANQRAATEPLLWSDTDDNADAFVEAMTARGLRCVQGGRFLHLMSNTHKGEAVQTLISAYQQQLPERTLTSVSCGDAPNDLDMLASTDIAVVIPGKHSHAMTVNVGNRVINAKLPGPAGWNESILSLLAERQQSTPHAR